MKTDIEILSTDLLTNEVIKLDALDITTTKHRVQITKITKRSVISRVLGVREQRREVSDIHQLNTVCLLDLSRDLTTERTDEG